MAFLFFFFLKGGRDQERDSAHISGPSVLLGKHHHALSLRQGRLKGTRVAPCSTFLTEWILNFGDASVYCEQWDLSQAGLCGLSAAQMMQLMQLMQADSGMVLCRAQWLLF